jgi:FemAB-related protein (PEP-CTERM system-associated)
MVEPASLCGVSGPPTDLHARAAANPSPAAACVVRTLAPSDFMRWNAFVHGHPAGTFFHLAEWARVLERAFRHRGHYLLAERAGQVVGVLPLAEVRSLLFGHALVSTPFCVYGGVLAADEGAQRALEQAACELGGRLGVGYLEMRNRTPAQAGWPTKELYVTFRRAIAADPEENLRAIPRKQRAMVRKGQQNGLRTEIDSSSARMYSIYSESLRYLGTPVFTRRYPAILRETFGEACEFLTVMSGTTAVASVLSFYFRDEVLPYYGGSTAAARTLAANDFMYWQVMERARARGARLFDFGRSKQGTGSFDFKVHWGFVPESLHYQYFLVRAREMPNLSPTNARYERLIHAWRRLPLPVTRLIGPPLARNLG